MKEIFRMNPAWLIGLAFLSLISFAGNSTAGEYVRDESGLTEEMRRNSVANDHCGMWAWPYVENIDSAELTAAGNSVSLRADIELAPALLGNMVREYVKIWIDWDKDRQFGRGDSEDYGKEEEECVMKQYRAVSEYVLREDGKFILTFKGMSAIPEWYEGGETWARVALKFNSSIGNSCGSLRFGDVLDVPLEIPDSSPVHDGMYIDDSANQGSAVSKKPGDRVTVANLLSYDGHAPRKVTLVIEVPDNWECGCWKKYDDSGKRDSVGGALICGGQEIRIENIVLRGPARVELYMRIPEDAAQEEVCVSSRLLSEDGEQLGEMMTADLLIGDGENNVVLADVYADDASGGRITVNKAAGDLIEIVHVLSNSGGSADVLLYILTPETWIFRKWYMRNDFAGTDNVNFTDEPGKFSDVNTPIGKIIYPIRMEIPASGKVQVGIRFQIPENASPRSVSVSSGISPSNILNSENIVIEEPENIEAVIVTNRDNLYEIYGDSATELLRTLFVISDSRERSDGKVKSVIYYADWYDGLTDDRDNVVIPEGTFRDWNNMEVVEGVRKARISNDAAVILDGLIKKWTDNLIREGEDFYLLIVGGDEILPFHRRTDKFYRSDTYGAVSPMINARGYYFTDMPYADTDGDWEQGGADVSYGRIVGASVSDMKNLIGKGLSGPQGTDTAVVASTQGVTDSRESAGICVPMEKVAETFEKADITVNPPDANYVYDMVENDTWICRDFVRAVNRGPKYVVQGSHGYPDKIELGLKLGPEPCCTEGPVRCGDIIKHHGGEHGEYEVADICETAMPAAYPFLNACGEEETMYGHLSEKGYSVPEMETYLLGDRAGDEGCCEAVLDAFSRLKVSCGLSTGYIENSVRTGGYFAGLVNCFAGVVHPRSDNPASCLAYEFIHKGVCGFFGSGAWNLRNPSSGSCCPEEGGLYAEALFSSFFENMPGEEVVGKVFKATLNEYKKQLAAPWNEAKDTRTVTEFNLFGIPWMKLNFPLKKPKSASEVSSDTEKPGIGKSSTKRLKNGDIIGSETRSGGIFSRTFTFSTADYDVSKEGVFDIITVPGTVLSYSDLKPVIPVYKVILSLPKGVSLISAKLTDGETQHIGQFNIPKLEDDPYASSGFTELTDVSGLYPRPNYWHTVAPMSRHDEIIIYFHPVQHDVNTRETTLWTEATVEVQYQVEECIFISALRTDKEDYITTEPVIVTATLQNVGDEDVTGLTAAASITRFGETLRTSQVSVGPVPAGGSTEVTVSVDNGLDTDTYPLIFEIRDESGSVTASLLKKGTFVTSGRTEIGLSGESIMPGDPLNLTVTYENYHTYQVTADILFELYDEKYRMVMAVPGSPTEIAAGSSESMTWHLYTGNLAPGEYEVVAVAEMESGDCVTRSEFVVRDPDDLNCDLAVTLADAFIALRLLVSEDTPPEFCFGDIDGDRKTGLAEVIHILRRAAGQDR